MNSNCLRRDFGLHDETRVAALPLQMASQPITPGVVVAMRDIRLDSRASLAGPAHRPNRDPARTLIAFAGNELKYSGSRPDSAGSGRAAWRHTVVRILTHH